ncbi:hypothetical protein HK414_12955 [Ramlibacter terrae]|uniref:Uncharacterized protein n=1 Tax=Ramlibacter terrae TaxID=2732511 RepID=A0ABX6P2S9_9BURK|nr:hypothetical protein HK414_12955 [Ramlibacter terrae]
MRKALKVGKPTLALVGGLDVKGAVFKDSLGLLKVLLSLAIRGEVRGLFVGYVDADGKDQLCITDAYRENPDRAAVQAMRLFQRLTREDND